MNNMHVTESIVTRAPEPDWSGWENWLRSHLDIERELMTEAFGEALGITCQELRDRISALELKVAELTGAIDILRGATPPPERDTRALGELLSTERREFGDLLERGTRGSNSSSQSLPARSTCSAARSHRRLRNFRASKLSAQTRSIMRATSSPLLAAPGRRSATPRERPEVGPRQRRCASRRAAVPLRRVRLSGRVLPSRWRRRACPGSPAVANRDPARP
jgi:hypothetical protein